MVRILKVLFRRDPSKDRQDENIHFEGYQFRWPDGQPVTIGLDAFCTHGQRLFGLGRQLQGCQEKLLELLCFPLSGREADMTKLPGHRVRRFFIERTDRQGRVHFMDGTPTAIVFEVDRDDAPVLHWIGLTQLRDGERQWFDLAARTLVAGASVASLPAFVNHNVEQLA
jgi:hypothetical protein